ncbi:MAG: hypothetical protein ACRD4O_11780 [Bryobacteraceae bacterium]
MNRPVPANSAYDLWPLSELTSQGSSAQIVLCDNTFALLQVAAGRNFPLNAYLNRDYPQNHAPQTASPGEIPEFQDFSIN